MTEQGCFALSEDQVFLLHLNYLQNQVNDMAVMKAYELNEIVPKCKFYDHTVKKTWKKFFKEFVKFEKQCTNYYCTDILAKYSDSVEEYVEHELEEFYFAIRREIKRNDESQPQENVDLLAKCVVALAIMDYAALRWNELNAKLKEHKFTFMQKIDTPKTIINSISARNQHLGMEHLKIGDYTKMFVNFERELFKAMKAKYINLNDSKICMLTFEEFDKKMGSEKVQVDMFEAAMNIKPIEDDGQQNKRTVKVGDVFRVGRGKYIAKQHTSLTQIKCDKCAFSHKASCNNFKCDSMYFEKL